MPKDDNTENNIGYKNPPTKTQFKKGRSGNPGGKKKIVARSFDDLLVNQLEARINKSGTTIIELIVSRAIKTAASGDIKAIKLLFEAYVEAKSTRKHAATDEDADREAAKRIFDLDRRYFTDVTTPAAEPPSAFIKASGEIDDENYGS